MENSNYADGPEAKLTALAGAPLETRGRVTEVSGRWIRLHTAAPVKPGTPVRLEDGDRLVLGEVASLDRAGAGWMVAVEIAHSLVSLADLERLNRALLGETAPAPRRLAIAIPGPTT